MINFLNHLTERLRTSTAARRERNATKWSELNTKRESRQRPPHVQRTARASHSEVKNRRSASASANLPKAEKNAAQKFIGWLVPPVTGVLTLVIVRGGWWPAPQLNDLLVGIGIMGEFPVIICIGFPVLLLVGSIAGILTKYAASPEKSNKNQPGSHD